VRAGVTAGDSSQGFGDKKLGRDDSNAGLKAGVTTRAKAIAEAACSG
jgi:hypothetical protein